MGLYFFTGVIIYLLILATLLVWFLKYHNNDGSGSKASKGTLDFNGGDEKEDSPVKPNQMSVDLIQAGAQSGSEKSEVLPGYCSQPKF